MRYMKFCGRDASVIALGTMDFGGRIEESRAREFMDAYVALSGNFIDTARIYGDFASGVQGGSEQVIGRWMAGGTIATGSFWRPRAAIPCRETCMRIAFPAPR